MSRRDDEQDVQAPRDECALGGIPMAGDENVGALFGALRDIRDLFPAPAPSASLTLLLERGFEPAVTSRSKRFRVAVGQRLAAAGLTLKVFVAAGVVGAGVATAGVIGQVPGEATVSDTVDAITPGGGDSDGGGDPARVGDLAPASAPGRTADTSDAAVPRNIQAEGSIEPHRRFEVPPGLVDGPGNGGDNRNGGDNGNGGGNDANGGAGGNGGKPGTAPGQVDKTLPVPAMPETPHGDARKDPRFAGGSATTPGQVDHAADDTGNAVGAGAGSGSGRN